MRGAQIDRAARKRRRGRAMAAALVALAVPAGCGDSGGSDPPQRPPESAERVPQPQGWELLTNRGEGFALAIPPGWTAGQRCAGDRRGTRRTTLICSPDRLVSVSVTADRTEEALAVPLDEFAERTLESIGEQRFGGELETASARGFRHAYDAAVATGTGVATSGVRQRVEAIALRRDRIVNLTAAIATSAQASRDALRLAERIVRTLRSRPIGAPVA